MTFTLQMYKNRQQLIVNDSRTTCSILLLCISSWLHLSLI